MRSTLQEDGLMRTVQKMVFIATTALLILLFAGADRFDLSHAAMDAKTEMKDRVTLGVNIGLVREAPSTNADVKFKLVKGDIVSVIETEGDWYLVEIKLVRQGWAHKSLFVEKTEAAEPDDTGLEKKETRTGPEAVLNVNVGRVREMPSTNADIKFKLLRGDTVSVLEEKDGWYLIEIKYNLQGWAHQSLFKEKISATEPDDAEPDKNKFPAGPKAVLDVNIGRVREMPSTNAEIKFKLYKGDTVSVIETEKDWFLIVTDDGDLGWAHQSLFTRITGLPEPDKAVPEKQETEKPAVSGPGKPAVEKPETDTGQQLILAVNIGRVRTAPSTDTEIKFRLVRGDIVSVVEKKDRWYLIKTEDGSTGWAHQNLFSEPQPVETAEKTGTTDFPVEPEAKEISAEPEPAETRETLDLTETPGKFESHDIKEIEFIMTPEGEEIVSFLLSGYYPPKTFSVVKEKPRVICDFFGAQLETGIERFQELNGDFIHQLRIGIHKGSRPKIRVIIDLVPDEDYDIRPVFFKEDNLYTLIVAKKK